MDPKTEYKDRENGWEPQRVHSEGWNYLTWVQTKVKNSIVCIINGWNFSVDESDPKVARK